MSDAPEIERNWYSNETATFGDRLADARQALGISQEDLAQRVGVEPATLARWEDDLSEPRVHRLNILSGLLNVSLRWLMTGEGEGLGPPDGVAGLPADVGAILTDLRQTLSDMVRIAERLGHIENRLKLSWKA